MLAWKGSRETNLDARGISASSAWKMSEGLNAGEPDQDERTQTSEESYQIEEVDTTERL